MWVRKRYSPHPTKALDSIAYTSAFITRQIHLRVRVSERGRESGERRGRTATLHLHNDYACPDKPMPQQLLDQLLEDGWVCQLIQLLWGGGGDGEGMPLLPTRMRGMEQRHGRAGSTHTPTHTR